MTLAPKVFYSYARADAAMRVQLSEHLTILRRGGQIREWHDAELVAGDDWPAEILRQLDAADIFLCLVSSSFLASQVAYEMELARAWERRARSEMTIVPVILRPCDWKATPLGSLNALPKGGKPITQWDDRDEAWLDVVTGIRQLARRQPSGRVSADPK
jgi:hypothetical protein